VLFLSAGRTPYATVRGQRTRAAARRPGPRRRDYQPQAPPGFCCKLYSPCPYITGNPRLPSLIQFLAACEDNKNSMSSESSSTVSTSSFESTSEDVATTVSDLRFR